MPSHIGLTVFIQVVLMDVVGLLLDLFLWWRGRPTITGTVRQHPLMGVPILVLQLIGAVGLFSHFYLEG